MLSQGSVLLVLSLFSFFVPSFQFIFSFHFIGKNKRQIAKASIKWSLKDWISSTVVAELCGTLFGDALAWHAKRALAKFFLRRNHLLQSLKQKVSGKILSFFKICFDVFPAFPVCVLVMTF